MKVDHLNIKETFLRKFEYLFIYLSNNFKAYVRKFIIIKIFIY